jgi:putative membrane protein
MASAGSRLGTVATPALLAGVVLFAGLVVRQGVGAVLDAVAVAGLAGLAAVTLFHLVPVASAAIGWHRLFPADGRPSLGTFLLGRWIGEAVNDMLPVAGVGGNVAKVQVLRRSGVPGVVAGASVVVDVTLVVATQLLFTVAGLVGFVLFVGETRTTLNAAAGLAVTSVLVAGFYLLQRRGLFGGLAGLLERVVEGPQFAALAGGARALDAEVKALYAERERVARSAAWHLVQWCTGAGEVWLALWFLGHPVGLLEAFLLESLSQAVRTAAFVVPAGIGVQEAGFLALGAVLGIPPQTALALSLVKRVPEIALGLPGLVAWWAVGRGGAAVAAADKPHRPHAVVRAVNRMAGPGRRLVRFDADALLAEARKRTGLHDFGSDDFREPLEVLLRSYDEEAGLTFVGRTAARMNTLRLLEQRLWFEEHRRRHPEIAAQEIRRPLVIVSLARAGTTILHRLLACDPANRTPLSWELMFPVPPPERATYDHDPRIARAERELRLFERWLAPGLPAVHEVGARLPEECLMIMAYAFRSFQFPSMNWVPSYQRWMEANDLLPGYAYHRRVLQHLQWRCPGERWVLKAPAHIFGIDEIFATYPDAGIVHMHRDPLDVAASLTSLTTAIYAAFSEGIDPHEVGRDLVETLHTGLARYFAARDRDPARNARFLDIDFRELAADPMGTVRRIYARFDMQLSGEADRRMRAFLAQNPKGKHGEHRYSLAQFGIDRDVEARRFQAYRERFGV